MPDEEQQGVEGGDGGGQDSGDQTGQSDDPGRIGLGVSRRSSDPQEFTRKAELDPDDPGRIKLQDLIEEERPGPER